MKFQRIKYDDLSAKQQEIYNFQKIASVLADYGFNCIKLGDDWQGADFLAYHKDEEKTIKVQLKGRMTIDKKYEGKKVYMAFPIKRTRNWYLISHDALVKIVKKKAPSWLDSDSWRINGKYHAWAPSKALIEALSEYALKPA